MWSHSRQRAQSFASQGSRNPARGTQRTGFLQEAPASQPLPAGSGFTCAFARWEAVSPAHPIPAKGLPLPEPISSDARALQAALASVSEEILSLPGGISFARLEGTSTYFTGRTHLRGTLASALAHSSFTRVRPRVVLGTNPLWAFLLLQAPSTAFAEAAAQAPLLCVAEKHNLTFQRLMRALTWDDWSANCSAFLALFAFTKAELEQGQRALAQFAQAQRQMRWESPYDAWQAHEGIANAELERRFGLLARRVWTLWCGSPGASPDRLFPRLRVQPSPPDPVLYTVNHLQSPGWENCALVPLSSLLSACVDTFFHSLAKLQADFPARQGLRAGLKEWKLRLRLDTGHTLERDLALNLPCCADDAPHRKIIETLFAQHVPLRGAKEQARIVSLDSGEASERRLELLPQGVEWIQIEPLVLHLEATFGPRIFDPAGERCARFAALRERLQLQRPGQQHLFQISDALEPTHAALDLVSLPSPSALAHPGEDAGLRLFTHAHAQRPPLLFRTPIPLSLGMLARTRRLHRLRLSETIGEHDYFILELRPLSTPAACQGSAAPQPSLERLTRSAQRLPETIPRGDRLWLRSPTSERPVLLSERRYLVLGAFR